MASPAGSGFPARTNSRLDAFLHRHLAPEVYDAIRAYEPCIVVSDSEKHTLKYLVLSDRLIYLTENPPKSIRQVVALRDVVAIDLVRKERGRAVGFLRIPFLSPLLPLLARLHAGRKRRRETFPFPPWTPKLLKLRQDQQPHGETGLPHAFRIKMCLLPVKPRFHPQ